MKRLYQLSILLLALLLPATATAYDFEVDGIYYNINGNEAIVTYQSYSNGSYFSDYSGDVTIPETVTYNGNTYSVTSIGECAFNNCSVLTSITIGNTVTSIDFGAFASCSTLTSVTIPNSVTSIGANAFQDCSALTSVTIGNSVISIDDWAFNGCSALTSIDIPNSVTSISAWAFSGCSALASVTIGNSVTHISDFAFYDCSRLTNIIVDRNNPVYDSRDNCNAIIETALNTIIVGSANTVIPNSVTSIGNYAFRGCSGLTGELNITNSVTEIGFEAFAWCNGLTSVVIGNSVTSIGNAAFRDCSGLTSISIGNSVTSIGNDAFRNCNRLTSVNIGNSVTSIGEYAFFDCTELHSLIFNAVNCTSIGYRAFTCNPFYFFTISVPCLQFGDSVQHIPAGLPNFDMSGKTLIIPNSVKTINASAINGNCAAVVIGNSLENIAAGTFPSDISVAYATTAEPLPCEAGAFANPQTLYVPAGCKGKYLMSDGWCEFANIVEGSYICVTDLTLDMDSATMHKTDTLQLKVTLLPEYHNSTTLEWWSTNTAVATVNSTGLVTALAEGEADICCWVDNKTVACHITVTENHIADCIQLNYTNLLLDWDNIVDLTATIYPDNVDQSVTWNIPENDNLYARVVGNKLRVMAMRSGSVTVTATSVADPSVSADCVITIQIPDVNGDTSLNIADVTALIDYLLGGNPGSINIGDADVDRDGKVNIADVTALIDKLLSGN